jgi:hypothetical protein
MKRGLRHPGQADHGPDQPRSERSRVRPARQERIDHRMLTSNLPEKLPVTAKEVDLVRNCFGDLIAAALKTNQ